MTNDKFIIRGGKKLAGEIEVNGAKNAALPILAATLLTSAECRISNVPLIEDVFTVIRILQKIGADVKWSGARTVTIRAKDIDPSKISREDVGRLRGSILFLGPLLARFRDIRLPFPGGCLIGSRPIDVHLDAIGKLGAKIAVNNDGHYFSIRARNLKPSEVVLKEFSVTATENVLMAASLMEGVTLIRIAACDYQVLDLCGFLRKLGVRIDFEDFNTIRIQGKKRLGGANHFVMYDPIEAGTFGILGALNGGNISVKNVESDHLTLFLEKLKDFGIRFILKKREKGLGLLKILSSDLRAANIQVLPPPGLYADFQPLFGLLATQSRGESIIHDPMYENRFKYIQELIKMGASAKVLDSHRVLITGPSALSAKTINAFDLRAGATLILAGLIARGETIINEAYQVDRGYEKIEERLQKLGADIKRVKSEMHQ